MYALQKFKFLIRSKTCTSISISTKFYTGHHLTDKRSNQIAAL